MKESSEDDSSNKPAACALEADIGCDESPPPVPALFARRKSRAMPGIAVVGSRIEQITEEEETKNETDHPQEQGISSARVIGRDKEEATDHIKQTPNDTVASTEKESTSDGAKAEDIVDEYYRRNRPYLTITSSSSMYDKSTELRRLPDYLKQMRARRGTLTSKKSQSAMSSRSRSRIGIPQTASATPSHKFIRSFYYLASKHRSIGFRHILMLLLVASYSLIGATMFYNIESTNEIKEVEETRKSLLEAIDTIAHELSIAARSNETIEKLVKNAYIKLLIVEGKYEGSAFYKLESDKHPIYTWTFGSAFFFSFTVFTTIGYGSIAPATDLGKACTILYAFICVPLTMVVLRDIGQFVLVTLTKVYARLLIKLRAARGYLTTDSEAIALPIPFCSLLSASYVTAAAVFIYNFDALHGVEGMDFFHSFYFSFISITTIGLGDVMPNNATFSPVIAIVFFFGLPIMRVVNRVSYVALENAVFGTMAHLEQRIDINLSGEKQFADSNKLKKVQQADVEMQKSDVEAKKPSIESNDQQSEKDSEDSDEEEVEEERARDELMNNFTIRSLATFVRTRSDVYGGDFGRVDHTYLSLHDTLNRFRPVVPPELIKIRITEVVDENGDSFEDFSYGQVETMFEVCEGEAISDNLINSSASTSLILKKNENGMKEIFLKEHTLRSYKCACENAIHQAVKRLLVVIEVLPSPDRTIYENEEGLAYRRRNASNKCISVDDVRGFIEQSSTL